MERSIAPIKQPIKAPDYIPVQSEKLSNGSTVHNIIGGSQELISLTLRLNAGSKYQNKLLTANICKDLLMSGTKKYSANEISEKVDFLGAYINMDYNQDFTTVQLFCMKKYFKELIPYLYEIVFDPLFPEDEFTRILKKKRQNFLVNQEKVHQKSKSIFFNNLYGDNHYYGSLLQISDYNEISLDEVKAFHSKYYKTSNMEMFMAGKYGDEETALLETYFGKDKSQVHFEPIQNNILSPKDLIYHEKKENALQSSIRLGAVTFDAHDKDYFDIKIVSTILGGYFGSRLMKNIREDKGYTYGIGSFQVALQGTGYFGISTEVGSSVTQKALSEIYYELNRMCTELVSAEELNLVKNYMLGNILKSADGVFNQAQLFKNLSSHELNYEHIHAFVERIRNINQEEVLTTAEKYLNRNKLHEIVIGQID